MAVQRGMPRMECCYTDRRRLLFFIMSWRVAGVTTFEHVTSDCPYHFVQ